MPPRPAIPFETWVAALSLAVVGVLCTALHAQSLVEDEGLAIHFISTGLWKGLLPLVGDVKKPGADADFGTLLLATAAVALVVWLVGAWFVARRQKLDYVRAMLLWSSRGGAWLWIFGAWEFLVLLASAFHLESAVALLRGTVEFWHVIAWSGLATTAWLLMGPELNAPPIPVAHGTESFRVPASIWVAIAIYTVVFGLMNQQLWFSLRVPHGDSAMYEEHLWNLLHGKGFRSYLDNGRLFLGEHIQVIHLGFIPLYLLWPSQLLLEWGQSLCLALGALPAFWMARRHSGSAVAGCALAYAYLMYVPMQFLDIAVDFKTFRPNGFEIPLLLFALDAFERHRLRSFLVFVALTLSCQEDAAPVLAPLGCWLFAHHLFSRTVPSRKAWLVTGALLAVFSVVYLIAVIKVVLPWFRGGGDVHFANYFSDLGGSSGDIVQNLVKHPERFAALLFSGESLLFALALLLPLGGLPLLSPGRLLVAAPLFGVLCLSDITNDPRHHFHAPMVPILIWATAAGLGTLRTDSPLLTWLTAFWWRADKQRARKWILSKLRWNGRQLPAPAGPVAAPQRLAPVLQAGTAWVLSCTILLGILLGLSPLGLSFWDPNSRAYWRTMYVPDKRAAEFPAVLASIPVTSRVASTDFVHPRFTHFERSYDYSSYRPIPPADTDFIVIDAAGPYTHGQYRRLTDVREFREHPEKWEVVRTGLFWVFKRKR